MNSKTRYILSGVAVAAVLLSGCGKSGSTDKSPKEVVLKAAQTEIKGELKGCYEVVDKKYKVKFAERSYDDDVVTVELKRTSKALPYDRKNVVIFPEADKSSAENCAGFGIEILDADGDVIDKINAKATPYSWDEMTAALQLLADETATIAFHFDDLSEAVSFRVTSLVQNNEERNTTKETKGTLEKEYDKVMDDVIGEYEDALDELADEYGKALDALFR